MTKICNVLSGLFLSLILSLVSMGLYADVNIGVITYNPPFVFGINQGFDIDLVTLVCQRLKLKCALTQLPYNRVFKALNEDKIDLIIGGITLPDSGLQNYICTMPYLVSRGQFVVLKSDKYNTVNDLMGGKVAVMKGEVFSSAGFEYLQQHYNGKLTIIPYDEPKALLEAFTNGTVDAAFINESSAHYWHQISQGKFTLLGKPIAFGQGIGMVALPKNSALINNINHALQGIEDDGSYIKLYNAYLMTGY